MVTETFASSVYSYFYPFALATGADFAADDDALAVRGPGIVWKLLSCKKLINFKKQSNLFIVY